MQGIILATRDRFDKTAKPAFAGDVKTPEGYLLALWRHECERVFADKMTNPPDKKWVSDAIMSLASEVYGKDLTEQINEPLYFVDFLREAALDADGNATQERPKKYEAVRDLSTLKERVEALQKKFNEENKVRDFSVIRNLDDRPVRSNLEASFRKRSDESAQRTSWYLRSHLRSCSKWTRFYLGNGYANFA